MPSTWWRMRGEARVGELRQYGVDQPTFLCLLAPGPGWDDVRALFEAWAAVRGPDLDGSRNAEAIGPLMDLGLTLHPVDVGTRLSCFRDCIPRIHGSTARPRR
ncbi:hypothetical protein ACFYRN_14590 [Streptomyces sp. NPDC005227]|uniref:hypothetical protein n=1 Tax=Streptomyces sp. NPDC005227 TaxID=3364707 RepID=UPI0036AD7720